MESLIYEILFAYIVLGIPHNLAAILTWYSRLHLSVAKSYIIPVVLGLTVAINVYGLIMYKKGAANQLTYCEALK